jgi:hypothetical protein
MANAGTDESRAKSMTAILNTDGLTIEALTANPANNALSVDDNTTGSNNGPTAAKFDDNHQPTMYALSSAGDGTKVPLYGLVSGNTVKLLINHT